MPLALTGYEVGLLTVALVLIAFALVVALVVPRSRPGFPSKWLSVFIGVCVVLFLAQMGAVVALAELGEEEHVEAAEPGEGETEPGATEPEETEPGATQPGETEPGGTETTPTETEPSNGGETAPSGEPDGSGGLGY